MNRNTGIIIFSVILTATLVGILFLTSRRLADFYFSMMSD